MPRSAPTVDSVAGVTFVHVAVRLIDQSGDYRTVSHDIAAADATDAKIEAYVAALAAATHADVFEVRVTNVFGAVPDSSNAIDAPKDSVFDNFVFQLKNTLNQSVRGFIPAPEWTLFIANTDQLDPTNADIIAYLTALEAIYADGNYSTVGARYTERREINEQVRF